MPSLPERPRRDYAAEEEAGRQLNFAHIQLRRGLAAESEKSVREILIARPEDAGAWELLGDIEASRGDFDAASIAYQTALRCAPGSVSAEAKFGRVTLRRAEQQRQEKLGVAYASSDTSLVKLTGGDDGKHSARWSVFGSLLCPGLGQIVIGQTLKGAVLVGIFLIGLVLLAILPHGTGRNYFTPGFWIVSAVLTADWIYSIADAAQVAPIKNSSASVKNSSPPGKDGWQI